MPSWMICHFSSGDRSTRGFLLMLPPVGGPESYRMRQSSFSGEHYTPLFCPSDCKLMDAERIVKNLPQVGDPDVAQVLSSKPKIFRRIEATKFAEIVEALG